MYWLYLFPLPEGPGRFPQGHQILQCVPRLATKVMMLGPHTKSNTRVSLDLAVVEIPVELKQSQKVKLVWMTSKKTTGFQRDPSTFHDWEQSVWLERSPLMREELTDELLWIKHLPMSLSFLTEKKYLPWWLLLGWNGGEQDYSTYFASGTIPNNYIH